MLKDVIEYVVGLGAKSTERRLVAFPNDPQKKIILSSDGHQILETPYAAKDAQIFVHKFFDFISSLMSLETLASEVVYLDHWCNPETRRLDGLVAVYLTDPPLYRNPIRMEVKYSNVFCRLSSFDNQSVTFNQQEFVRFLRLDMLGLIAPDVLDVFRTMKFEQMAQAQANYQHGMNSLDSKVLAKATAKDGTNSPEEFEITLNPLETIEGLTLKLVMTVDIDVPNKRFILELRKDSYQRCVSQVMEFVRKELQAAIVAPKWPEGKVPPTVILGNLGVKADAVDSAR